MLFSKGGMNRAWLQPTAVKRVSFQELAELRARKRLAIAEGCRVESGPHAAAIGHDQHEPALRRHDPPHLAQHFFRIVGELEAVDDQREIDRAFEKRQVEFIDQSGGALALLRPVDDPLPRHHEAEAAGGFRTPGFEIGRRKAEAHDRGPAQ